MCLCVYDNNIYLYIQDIKKEDAYIMTFVQDDHRPLSVSSLSRRAKGVDTRA